MRPRVANGNEISWLQRRFKAYLTICIRFLTGFCKNSFLQFSLSKLQNRASRYTYVSGSDKG